jgi:DNA-binding NarL/FixJ family response regulator
MKGEAKLPSGPPPDYVPTPRQLEAVRLFARGLSLRAIAQAMGITESTVAIHKFAVMHNYDLHSTVELVLWAMKQGLVDPPVALKSFEEVNNVY